MLARRDFLRATAAVMTVPMFPWPFPGIPGSDRLDDIGIQLYTVRSEMQRDFEGTLAKIAAIGYREVEFAGYFDRSPEQVRSALERLTLAAPAGHMPYEALQSEAAWGKILDSANRIGHQYVVIAWTPTQERKTLDDWKRIAEQFNRAGRAARNAGLTFAYHNHEFEFTSLGQGPIPFDLLLAETDPDLVKIEMDLYWITLGGFDPLQYFQNHPGRFPMVHVKDMKKGGDRPRMVDVGQGDIDFRAILARRNQAGIRHFFVEHDEPASPLGSARVSYDYLKALEFPDGP